MKWKGHRLGVRSLAQATSSVDQTSFSKHLLSIQVATKPARCRAYRTSIRHRFCSHRAPSFVEGAETKVRIQHGGGQDKLRVLWGPRAKGNLPSLEGMRTKEGFL